MATGTLEASAGTPSLGVGTARAELKDTISILLPTGYSSSTVQLTVGLNFSSVTLQGEAVAEDDILLGQFPGFFTSADGALGSGNDSQVGRSLAINAMLTLPVSNPNNLINIPIDTFLTVTTGDNTGNGYAVVDPDLSIILPDGVTFTSGSGVLLTQVAAVPEPTSLVLLGAGLLGFAIVRRRRTYSAPM